MVAVATSAHLRVRVPWSVHAGETAWQWLLGAMMDAALAVLVQCDRVLGTSFRIQEFHSEAPFRPGEYLELRAELVHWEGNLRSVEVVARKVVAGAGDVPGRFVPLAHPDVVGSGIFVVEVPDGEEVGIGLPDPLVITVAPTGFDATKEDSPYLPVTPQEVAEEVARAAAEGASAVHLHVRGPQGEPCYDPAVVGETVAMIRSRCDIVVQVSTEGPAEVPVDTRGAILEAPGVEMASLVAGSTNHADHIVFNSRPVMEHLAARIQRARVAPVVEILDLGFLENAKLLARKGLLRLPAHFVFTLGLKGAVGARRENLELLVSQVPRGSTWSAAGIGRHQLVAAEMAVAMGGHVRVGMENGVYTSPGKLTRGNAELVAAVAEMARRRGRPVATAEQARRILGLSG